MSKSKKIQCGGLYRPEFEKDSCGFGLIAHMDGKASHWIVDTAITSLARLTHRGAIAADGKTGDGCGLLMKKPDTFLRQVAAENDLPLTSIYAVGNIFLSRDTTLASKAKALMEEKLTGRGLKVSGWRTVPTDTQACGEQALNSLPVIEQVFVNAPEGMSEAEFNQNLFIARRQTEHAVRDEDDTFYVTSLSSKVISYKGLVMPANLPVFYQDLKDERFHSSLVVYHQRFSTNTWPQWRLSQPFRFLAHNGEINTVQGNRNWAIGRSNKLLTGALADLADIDPIISTQGSDSESLDNMLEMLMCGGMDLFRAMRLLVPPAWQNVDTMDDDLRAFYEFSSLHMEPWDGPAGMVMTDGRYAACAMDRNGLRPARYIITKDRHITLASEIGVYPYNPEDVATKGRLKPGQMIAVDTDTGQLLLPEDIDNQLKQRHPYRRWLNEHAQRLESRLDQDSNPVAMESEQLGVYEKQFQVTFEERDQVLRVLGENGQEAVGSMGDDTPLPVLSRRVRPVYDYFRQQFAQVTNPPIDPLREQIVMSLTTYFGGELNLFDETERHGTRLEIDSPVLSRRKFARLMSMDDATYKSQVIDLNYESNETLQQALERVCDNAVKATENGAVVLVLSDRNVSNATVPIPALMATGAVHHRLIREGIRCNANIVVETASARDPHHFAVLIGYGATAVYPYLAYASLHDMVDTGMIREKTPDEVCHNYRKGINKGLYKILSKMGISTIASYRGAQLFEAVGLHEDVVNLCFKGTTTRLQGSHFTDLENDQKELNKRAWDKRSSTEQGGLLKFIYGGEDHAYNPDVVSSLRKAVESGDYQDYKVYADLVNNRPTLAFRDLLAFRKDITPISIDEVEPVDAIMPRFDSAGMSLGALSPEAHESLAIAMNRLGGRSNSGEGGEDPARYGTERVSKIKQIASGRFGVTPHYLVNAEVLQIKVAQGAKPGEGGQLPGDKVNSLIATLRYSKPGVSLISPPPHHDIYSIEDLAQLIFDLKQVNPDAMVSVKLVAEAGVGTIAAGVAKAYADFITIAGHDGGTGASPLTSVKYAGSPWELGLTETHQTLRNNDLRDKVRVQTDGGLKTGLDVVKAAMLGAESFGFGTGPMIALGCKYLRICHLNNCATGVATQNDTLRDKHFRGLPEMVMNYFHFIAEETREWMALLGVRTMDELIGRADLLEMANGATSKQQGLNLNAILSDEGVPKEKPHRCQVDRNRPFDQGELAERMVQDTLPAIENREGGEFSYAVENINRSIGARLSGEIAKRYGNQGMADTPVTLRLNGTAGQSFGVWNAGGLNMYLEGDANDYVGKGMAGGKLVINPPANSAFTSRESTIIGNTCLYGATGGKLFAAGLAGERFAVRNSGATAVVEGVGDHGCEYMTGGIVVVLGNTGVNFGAGMTGGFSYVLDLENCFPDCYNHELVDIHRITTEAMDGHRAYLKELIREYMTETRSAWAEEILNDFSVYAQRFWLIKPKAAALDTLLDALRSAA